MGTEFDPKTYAGWRATTLGRITERLEVDLVLSLARIGAGDRVLDIGTGDGTCAIAAARRGGVVSAVDTSQAMLDAAAERAREARVQVDFQVGSASALPFGDASFDRVLAVTVLGLVPDPGRALAELVRVTRPGGQVVLGELGRWSVWAARRRVLSWLRGGLWEGAHFWSQHQLRRLAQGSGLRVRTVRGAVYFPPVAGIARRMERIDAWLGRAGAPGAAFLALAAERP